MAWLLFPSGKLVKLGPTPLALGRVEVAKYPEAITVSRVQCVVKRTGGDDGKPALRLTSTGSQNPTLVVKPQQQPFDVAQGDSVILRDGDSFSLVSTRPDLAIRVQLESTASDQPANLNLPSALRGHPSTTLGRQRSACPQSSAGMADSKAGPSGGVRHENAAPSPSQTASRANTSDDHAYTSDGHESVECGECDTAGAEPRGTTGAAGAEKGGEAGTTRRKGPRGLGNGKPPAESVPPVVLLLAGVPGSGKSTLSRNLLQAAPIAWVHVSQDAISNGRPGSRQQCLSAVLAALQEGACCVVDRCHCDTEQRSSFLKLAAERGVAAHCVVLQPPMSLCASRVAARTDHPGGVQGEASKRVVYQMTKMQQQRDWPPSAAAEGLASVMDCHDDADANASVRAWAAYGAGTGCSDAGPSAVATSAASQPAAGVAATSPTHGSGAAAAGEGSGQATGAGMASAAGPAAATLAIWQEHAAKRKSTPASILSYFKPQDGKAAPAGGSISGAGRTPTAGLAKGPSDVAARAAGQRSSGAKPSASAVAGREGAAGSRGKPAGPGGGRAGHKRRAPAKDEDTLLQAAPAPKKQAAADAARHGHADGAGGAAGSGSGAGEPEGQGAWRRPGASPDLSRGGDGAMGRLQAPAVSDRPVANVDGGGNAGGTPAGGRNAFSVLMASASRKAADARVRGTPGAAAGAHGRCNGAEAEEADVRDPRFKFTGPWAQALRDVALAPEKAPQTVLYKDDKVVMLADAFPKAKHHVLVVARDPNLESIANLRKEHVPLLEHMREVAQDYIRDLRTKELAAVAFKLGFHAIPSMRQLHMHVVSQDFDSDKLKHKKHWNSFTTKFFLSLEAVKRELEVGGRLAIMRREEQEHLEKQDLKCHGCSTPFRDLPKLKAHIVVCDAVKQLSGL